MRIAVLSLLLVAFGSTCLVADEAEYRLTFDGGWSLPPLPGGAHFTPLIGATHSAPDQIFYVGGFATDGVEDVAETGSTTALTIEINQLIQTGDVGTRIFRPGNIGPVSDVTVDFVADSENSLMTMLTMIAPSPDWFVGVNSFDLREGNRWIDKAVLELNSYDAGTENGETYSLSNPPTSPHSTIEMLDVVEPNNPLFGFGSVATLTITRTDVSLFDVGDVNRDGGIDLLDVAPFVAILNAGAFTTEADINCDGSVTLLDVQPFVELLSGN